MNNIDIFDIARSMQDLINDNSLNLKFKVFTFVQNLDKTFEKNAEGKLETFIPCIVSQVNGQYRPIPELLISDQDFMFQVYFPIRQRQQVLKCLDELSTKIVGQMVGIKSLADGTVKRYPMTMDIPNLSDVQPQHIQELNRFMPEMQMSHSITEYYGTFQSRIYFIKSDDLTFGNDFEMQVKIDEEFVRIYTSNISIGNAKNIRNEQIFNAATSKGLSLTNAVVLSFTAYYKPELNSLLQDIRTGANQNKVYQLRTLFGSGTEITQDVIIINAIISVVPGTPITITADIGFAATSVLGS